MDEEYTDNATVEEAKDEDFGIKNPINSVVDGELNRIWGYISKKDKELKQMKELCSKMERISEDIEEYKAKNTSEVKESEDNIESEKNQETSSEDKELKIILEEVNDGLFKSELFMKKLAEEVNRQIRANRDFKIVNEGNALVSARFEFGYAKKGNIIFFKKAFKNVLWHLPDDMALVTNTGFVAVKDSFWLVIGEDSELEIKQNED